jgi:hypothetical protein
VLQLIRVTGNESDDGLGYLQAAQPLQSQPNHIWPRRHRNCNDGVKVRIKGDDGCIPIASRLDDLRVFGPRETEFANVIAIQSRLPQHTSGIARYSLIEEQSDSWGNTVTLREFPPLYPQD